jgi:hypothetical protein
MGLTVGPVANAWTRHRLLQSQFAEQPPEKALPVQADTHEVADASPRPLQQGGDSGGPGRLQSDSE